MADITSYCNLIGGEERAASSGRLLDSLRWPFVSGAAARSYAKGPPSTDSFCVYDTPNRPRSLDSAAGPDAGVPLRTALRVGLQMSPDAFHPDLQDPRCPVAAASLSRHRHAASVPPAGPRLESPRGPGNRASPGRRHDGPAPSARAAPRTGGRARLVARRRLRGRVCRPGRPRAAGGSHGNSASQSPPSTTAWPQGTRSPLGWTTPTRYSAGSPVSPTSIAPAWPSATRAPGAGWPRPSCCSRLAIEARSTSRSSSSRIRCLMTGR